MERGFAVLILCIDVGSGIQEKEDDLNAFRSSWLRSVVKGRIAMSVYLMDVAPVRQEKLEGLRPAVLGSRHYQRNLIARCVVWIRSGIEQRLHQNGVVLKSFSETEHQRGGTKGLFRPIGFGVAQFVEEGLKLSAEGRRTVVVNIAGIGIGSPFESRQGSRGVFTVNGIEERACCLFLPVGPIGQPGGQVDDQQQDNQVEGWKVTFHQVIPLRLPYGEGRLPRDNPRRSGSLHHRYHDTAHGAVGYGHPYPWHSP